jgi:molybdopterin molybdotransferase
MVPSDPAHPTAAASLVASKGSLDEIAATIAGYDPKALSVPAAQAFIEALVGQWLPPTETVSLQEALDRVLARDVLSAINVPAHDNSAMDGFALRASDLLPDAVTRLSVVGAALAGAPYRGAAAPGAAVRITTGAVMPEGLDTVVPSEFVQVEGNHVHVPPKVVQEGDNRRRCGEDLRQGLAAVNAGETLGPAELGLIASLGVGHVSVHRKLRVAYFSTGDEIHSMGQTLSEGGVYDSNRYTVTAMLRRLNMQPIDLGVVKDDPASLEAAFLQAAEQADAVITSGGVSVGEADHTKQVMARLGDVKFWRIAMRPGRPMAIGKIERSSGGSALLFGLPGNPVAVMVTFYAFVRQALLQMAGSKAGSPPMLRAACLTPLRKKPGRTEYQRGIVRVGQSGDLVVEVIGNQGSGVLSSMSQANGLIVLDHGHGDVAVGSMVNVWMFDGLMQGA